MIVQTKSHLSVCMCDALYACMCACVTMYVQCAYGNAADLVGFFT